MIKCKLMRHGVEGHFTCALSTLPVSCMHYKAKQVIV